MGQQSDVGSPIKQRIQNICLRFRSWMMFFKSLFTLTYFDKKSLKIDLVLCVTGVLASSLPPLAAQLWPKDEPYITMGFLARVLTDMGIAYAFHCGLLVLTVQYSLDGHKTILVEEDKKSIMQVLLIIEILCTIMYFAFFRKSYKQLGDILRSTLFIDVQAINIIVIIVCVFLIFSLVLGHSYFPKAGKNGNDKDGEK